MTIVVGTVLATTWWNAEEAPEQNMPAVHIPIDPHTLRAAREGDVEAQVRMAKTLLIDVAGDRDQSAEAVRWLQSAAENGNPSAMVQLGRLYRNGFGVLQDFDLAAKWIQTAAVRGDPEGMLELGRLYRDGIGFTRDPVRAYVWFNRAAAALHVDAVRDREEIARSLDVDQLKEAQAQSAAAEEDSDSEPANGAATGPATRTKD